MRDEKGVSFSLTSLSPSQQEKVVIDEKEDPDEVYGPSPRLASWSRIKTAAIIIISSASSLRVGGELGYQTA